ncbi:MAG: hypothetical protein M3O70_01575 [Actinomycetota bacterium]|nr:hypothetical protein [Actinomycetota bacterium]
MPWSELARLRDVYIHHYHRVAYELVSLDGEVVGRPGETSDRRDRFVG